MINNNKPVTTRTPNNSKTTPSSPGPSSSSGGAAQPIKPEANPRTASVANKETPLLQSPDFKVGFNTFSEESIQFQKNGILPAKYWRDKVSEGGEWTPPKRSLSQLPFRQLGEGCPIKKVLNRAKADLSEVEGKIRAQGHKPEDYDVYLHYHIKDGKVLSRNVEKGTWKNQALNWVGLGDDPTMAVVCLPKNAPVPDKLEDVHGSDHQTMSVVVRRDGDGRPQKADFVRGADSFHPGYSGNSYTQLIYHEKQGEISVLGAERSLVGKREAYNGDMGLVVTGEERERISFSPHYLQLTKSRFSIDNPGEI